MAANLNDQIEQLHAMISAGKDVVALTGAGISVPIGIPDLAHMPREASSVLASESELERNPAQFYATLHRIFLDPIVQKGPTVSHRALAALEQAGAIDGVVTTNVDYLHEIAGSYTVADVWNSFNVNYCIKCGRTYPLSAMTASAIPTCPIDGGYLSPAPAHNHIAQSQPDLDLAGKLMRQADMVIVIGATGYYSNINRTARVAQINPAVTGFDRRSELNIHAPSDEVFRTFG
ncbi:hypothetical protein PQ472_03260 [Lacticaseibacillus pabuli]|uniref:protein acetyllysine N-acetyltransferase n=1 Tax=Lacticaseibacillus pabuli TaxID=3025672 RepID=A0ABY7WVU3_9LACO|nr:Sir2 family NAD-dependent protein deacetylase [Lacticaseibacillus sp. KACC 23028]WDF83270.1 hypothetical protein PQ472_03260 [Lacticaseibacillus sp. KACC 23028]